MFYKSELGFIIESLKKCRLNAAVISLDNEGFFRFSKGLERVFGEEVPSSISVSEIKPKCLYKAHDGMKLAYRYFLLPESEVPTAVFLGPYLDAHLSVSEMFEIGEKNGVLPSRQRYLEEYYASVPVLSEDSALFIFLDSFLERIFKSPSFAIIDVDNSKSVPQSPIASIGESAEDSLARMKTIEKRYEFENEMIRAVSLGQVHKERQLLGIFSENVFEKRNENPLRDLKNYGIIMNTLLRKAAETGGVHPLYIDRVSTDFALKIEDMKNLSGCYALMTEMFKTYSLLVRNHAVKKYSPLVRSVIVFVDADLTAELSLASIAEKLNVSSGYLSAVFHKETGKTLTQYVRDRRMENAEYLLATTNLEIQTVALHSGILDLQYFSKLFKKHTGKTPREYREQARKES